MTTYSVKISTDNGKTFNTVRRTTDRALAFASFTYQAGIERTILFEDNRPILMTHFEDAERIQAYRAENERDA